MNKKDIIDKWNSIAKKKIYINETVQIPVGRLVYLIILNIFITIGMICSGTTGASLAWLWVDMISTLYYNKKKEEKIN